MCQYDMGWDGNRIIEYVDEALEALKIVYHPHDVAVEGLVC